MTGKTDTQLNVTWAHAVRDMTVAAIDRGQLPLFGALFIITVIIVKLPSDAVLRLANSLLERFYTLGAVGHPLFAILIIAWAYHVRRLKKGFRRECERIGREKSRLQEQIAGVKFKSSE